MNLQFIYKPVILLLPTLRRSRKPQKIDQWIGYVNNIVVGIKFYSPPTCLFWSSFASGLICLILNYPLVPHYLTMLKCEFNIQIFNSRNSFVGACLMDVGCIHRFNSWYTKKTLYIRYFLTASGSVVCDYLLQINLILKQFEGIKEGYLQNKSVPSIDDLGFL